VFRTQARRLFAWKEDAWCDLPENNTGVSDIKERTKWIAVSLGHRVDSVTTSPKQGAGYFSDINVVNIVSPIPPFFRAQPRMPEYSSWLDSGRRPPLVLATRDFRRGLGNWSCGEREKTQSSDVIECFCKSVIAWSCDDSGYYGERQTLNLTSPWVRENTRVHSHLRSSNGIDIWALIWLPDVAVCDCRGDKYGGLYWFVRRPHEAVEYLGSNMNLVDYGDYNGTGDIAFLFQISKDNEDGYRIYWKGLASNATFTWNYH
jgi:hypothetical protein